MKYHGTDKPFFSIVIPTYNRPNQLTACLRAITRLNYSRERMEVIVVDDGGELSLESVIARFRKGLDLTLITQLNTGPAAARNKGAAQAKGDFLVFIDDDCKPAPSWIETLSIRFSAATDVAIGGRTLNTLPDNPYSTTTHVLIKYLYTHFNRNPEQSLFVTSNNLALPAGQFHELGGFNTGFLLAGGEDREFCDHWLYHGYQLIYAPEVIVYHTHKLTFRSFCKQHFNYGRGAYHFHRLRAQRSERPIRMESLEFYLDLLRYPLSQSSSRRMLLLAILMVIAQVANTVGFFSERAKKITFP
jgi:GT2 family glycosyltransferase